MTADRERDLIHRLFLPSATSGAALGLNDDAAILRPPANTSLVLTKDALVEGVHFLPDDPPEDIAAKALAVNLSDIAGMAGKPAGFLSALALPPDRRGSWLERFAVSLASCVEAYDCPLLGGDITATPGPLTISITALGYVLDGQEMRRDMARPGDIIAVSGTIGDGALGLKVRLGEITGDAEGYLVHRYRRPQPRVGIGTALAGRGAAGMDISDGLVGDLSRMCRLSGTDADLDASTIPLSSAARQIIEQSPQLWDSILTGGDDYELLVSAPIETLEPLLADRRLTAIGQMRAGVGNVDVTLPSGRNWTAPERAGYSHI